MQSTPASPAAAPPRGGAPPVVAPPASQPATSRGESPQRYHRKKDNTAVIVSAISGVGILIVGALLLVFVFSKDDDDLGNRRRGGSSRRSTTSTSDDKPRRNVERQKADDEKPRDRHAQLPNASGNDSQPATAAVGGVTIADASSVFKEAISSWRSGTSHGGFLAAAGHVEKIDILEWKEYAFDIEKSSIDPDNFSSNTERRFWLNVAFKNQGADPIRRLYAVKLGRNGRWTITPLKDGAAAAEENEPATEEAKPGEAKPGDPDKAAAAEAENAEREDE